MIILLPKLVFPSVRSNITLLQPKVEVITLRSLLYSKRSIFETVYDLADQERLVQNKKKPLFSQLSVIGTPERRLLVNLDTSIIYLPLQSSESLNEITSES